AVHLRPVRDRRRFTRLGTGPRDRASARGRARWQDRRRVVARQRHHDPGAAAAYGRLIRTSSHAASTVLARPRSAAANTIRTVCPAHRVIEMVAVFQAGRSVSAAPTSWRTTVRTPAASSTYARK